MIRQSKTMVSKNVLQAREVNLLSSTQRVSGDLSNLQPYVVKNLNDFNKSIQSGQILPHMLPKYC